MGNGELRVWSYTRRFGWIDVNKNSALFHTYEHNARKEDKKFFLRCGCNGVELF